MSDELKPCPFCGGEGEVNKSRFLWIVEWRVWCKTCWATTHGYADTNVWKQSRQEAIDVWNRRTKRESEAGDS